MNNPVRLLAEKIVDTLCSRGLDGGELPFVESLLSAAFKEAMDETNNRAHVCAMEFKKISDAWDEALKEARESALADGIAQGRTAAFKEAAEIVDGAAIDVGLLEKSVVGYEEKKRLERLADKLRLKSEGT